MKKLDHQSLITKKAESQLLKHRRNENDGRDGRHGCTVVNGRGLNLCVVPSLTEPGDRNLERQIKFREGGYVQRFKLIINWV